MSENLSHEWHVAINKHTSNKEVSFEEVRFMYDAKSVFSEIPRMEILFKMEREDRLPKTHKQCSRQDSIPVQDNHLKCCLGVKTKECPHLLALNKIQKQEHSDLDKIKAWTCGAHIVSKGGDTMNEGYLLTVNDRMYWDNLYSNLAQ